MEMQPSPAKLATSGLGGFPHLSQGAVWMSLSPSSRSEPPKSLRHTTTVVSDLPNQAPQFQVEKRLSRTGRPSANPLSMDTCQRFSELVLVSGSWADPNLLICKYI